MKTDGEEEPVKFLYGEGSGKKTLEALKGILVAARVQVSYKADGATRLLVGIRKPPTRASGTVTGVVLHNHGWWVVVKPKGGPPDGYADNFPFIPYAAGHMNRG